LQHPCPSQKKMEAGDKPIAALLRDLKNRGMLDDTLVIFCGEFGRTSYCEGRWRSIRMAATTGNSAACVGINGRQTVVGMDAGRLRTRPRHAPQPGCGLGLASCLQTRRRVDRPVPGRGAQH